MEKTELLASLETLSGKYEQHRLYIEKARAQAATGKFNAAVIEKVVLDHEIKSSDLADQVNPLLPKVAALLAELEAEKAKIEASKGTVDEQIQELELRAMIGELTDAELEKETADLRANQTTANERIAVLQGDWDALNGALDRWAGLATPAGHYSAPAAPAAAAPVAPPPTPEPEPEPEVAQTPTVDEDAGDSPSAGAHGARTEIREDLSSIFTSAPAEPAAQIRVSAIEEEVAIETGEVNEDVGDAPSADVPFGFEEDVGASDASASAAEVEIEIGSEAPAQTAPAASDEAPRRALLLYQEGTAEEQIYPFTGEQLTIGRGRENDIQIKNDSKVSRYHCKLFRRGNNFYIEDQKSSNGSLVNGELITDRRLFGGEEIVIGETFFRFRIME